MTEIILDVKGPFTLVGQNSLFKATESELSGLYFFTFKLKDKYLIEYVGITSRDFKTRFQEHIGELLSGGYQLYDLQKLRDNKPPSILWKGKFCNDKYDITEFLDNYMHHSQLIEQQLQKCRIFLIPLNTEKRILERIEGSIYNILRTQNKEPTMTFIKGVRSSQRYENEEPITVKVESNSLLSEIPSNFKI